MFVTDRPSGTALCLALAGWLSGLGPLLMMVLEGEQDGICDDERRAFAADLGPVARAAAGAQHAATMAREIVALVCVIADHPAVFRWMMTRPN